VIVDIGDGRYAFYAQMMPGSVAVTVNERVQPGMVLGRLGNSGNSDAPTPLSARIQRMTRRL
jgi:murein DD-endopeptidase MepM/ murein hydrolase activator NlpD